MTKDAHLHVPQQPGRPSDEPLTESFARGGDDANDLLQHSITARTEASRPQARRVSATSRFGQLGGAVVALIGCVVFVGWIADLPGLTRVTPDQVSMRLNAAMCVIALGVGTALLAEKSSAQRRRWSLSCALFVVALAGLTLAEYAAGLSLGIDDPFAVDAVGVGTLYPGRISLGGAATLLMLGAALALAARNRTSASQVLASLGAMFGVIVLVGYTYEVAGLYAESQSNNISLLLGVSALVAGLSIMLLRTGEGPLSMLTGNTAGGIVVRRLMPVVLITPLLLGFLVIAATRTGRIGNTAAMALAMGLLSFAGAVLVWRQGRALRHVDLRRSGAEDALSLVSSILAERDAMADRLAASEAYLRLVIATSADGYIATDIQGQITGWNDAATSIFGWSTSDAIGQRLEKLIVPPEMAEAHLAGLESFRRTGTGKLLGHTVELEGMHRSGHRVPVELTIWAVKDAEGVAIHAFAREITARKATADALRRANEDLTEARVELMRRQAFTDAVLETVDVGIVFCDADGTNPVRNRAQRNLLGLGAEQSDVPHGTLASVVEVLDGNGLVLAPDRYPISRALRGETVGSLDVRVGPVGGPYRDVVTSATPIMAPDDDLVGAVAVSTDVTAERTALRELAAERSLLAEAQRIGQLGSFTNDVASGQSVYSPEIYRIWGVPETADLDALWTTMIHPDDLDQLVEDRDAVLRGANVHTSHYRIVRPDGAVRHLRSTREVVRDKAGAPATIVGTHLDITDLTVAQREAVEANTLLTSILTATPDLIFVSDVRTGGVVYVSPGKSILGVTSEQIEELGTSIIAALVHPDQQEGLRTLNQAALDLADGDIQQFFYQARHSDGSWHWLSRRVTPFRRDPVTGKVTEVLGVVRDVDHEQRLELSLRDSEARFRALVTQVVDYAIIGLGIDGVIQSWNIGAERLKGYTKEQAVGQSFAMFYTAEDLEAGIPQQLLETARSRGRVEASGWRVRRDGTTFWADVVITALRDQDGEPSGFVKVTRDLTEQRRLEAAQESLFATVSHDLKAPITVIKMLAEMIPDGDPDTRIEYAQRIAARADHLVKLVEELADQTNLREGAVAIRPEPLALPALAKACVLALGPLLEEHRVHIANTDEDTVAMADRTAMERILSNLLGNAAKYSPAGSTLTISFEQTSAVVRIAVSDKGRGIAPEDLDTIFDEFARGRMAQVDGGTGLGLASARRLVELQGGSVWIDSEVGQGTTVTVELPRKSTIPTTT